jgi:cytochrome c553
MQGQRWPCTLRGGGHRGRSAGALGGYLACALALAGIPALAAGEDPEWAYPAAPAARDVAALKRVPGSTRAYTQTQIDDGFNPPDWFPEEHPPMPEIVAHGRAPAVRACAFCHLPSGDGYPETARLAGSPLPYLLRQMDEFRSERRKGARAAIMTEIAKAASEEDARAAGAYFASLEPRARVRVVETKTAPKSVVGTGGTRFAAKGGETEPIRDRIIEIPEDEEQARVRHPHGGFIAYVPEGSIAKGKVLVTTGGTGTTLPCDSCHGPSLQGLGDVPGIAGRSPTYLFRQLRDMKTGNRSGPAMELMKVVVARLGADDMIAIAAYVGSLDPRPPGPAAIPPSPAAPAADKDAPANPPSPDAAAGKSPPVVPSADAPAVEKGEVSPSR